MVKMRAKKSRRNAFKINVYCDMDGVIADFEGQPKALERFQTEKGFFKQLTPINKEGLQALLNNPYINLFILSASPNRQADKDKIEWLKYHYPQIKKKVEAKVMIGVGSLLFRRLPAHVKKKSLFGLYIIRVLLVSAAFFFFFSLIEQVALYDLGN